ncbi:MAG: type-F conjugative transfer system protein TraW [Cyanobacteria bacterium K_DeepCast_35m_m2_023]|nr:type-F conjugative transfer system protein TraW [Cyanobacteria bacterium K_DeepCast_35m_m2_023]
MNKCPLLAFIFLFSFDVQAVDFGKQGNTFPVKEEGFIAMIQRKLKGINLEEHREKMRTHAKRVVEEPSPVARITRAIKTVSHSFDPSYILQEDVILPCGKLLYAAGESVNPLDHMSWEGKLLFIDARDKEQVEWVLGKHFGTDEQEPGQNKENNNKIVLVAGRPLELEEELQQPIYFDQSGELTTKFNIAHVPAVVEQEGKYLKVTEIDIREDK